MYIHQAFQHLLILKLYNSHLQKSAGTSCEPLPEAPALTVSWPIAEGCQELRRRVGHKGMSPGTPGTPFMSGSWDGTHPSDW